MGRKGRPTLFDVARAAQVGATTVSRVLNGGNRLDPKTLKRVQAAMRKLKYHPNQAARALKSDCTRIITVVVPSIADPFFASVAREAQKMGRANDYAMLLLSVDDDPNFRSNGLVLFQRHRVDGLLLVPPSGFSESFLDGLRALDMPVVCIDQPVEGGEFSSVLCDNLSAAERATSHLIEHGRKRILCFGGDPDLYSIQQRVRGYEAAVARAGLPRLVQMNVVSTLSAEAILKFYEEKGSIDAIFSLYNSATIQAFEVLQEANIRLPEDVSIVGFDDFKLASVLRPSVSVVEQPVEEIGKLATQLLFEQLNDSGATVKQLSVATRFIPRQSCGCVPPPAHRYRSPRDKISGSLLKTG